MYGITYNLLYLPPTVAIQYNEAAAPPIGVDCHGLALPILAMTRFGELGVTLHIYPWIATWLSAPRNDGIW